MAGDKKKKKKKKKAESSNPTTAAKRKASPAKKRPASAASTSSADDLTLEILDRALVYHAILASGAVRSMAAIASDRWPHFAINKACADLKVPHPSAFHAAADAGGSGKIFKAGATLRAGIAASASGLAVGEVIASHVPSGPRRVALFDARLIDAEGAPTEAASRGLASMQANLDYVATQSGDVDAAVRYAEWAKAREEEMRIESMLALRDLEEEFDDDDDDDDDSVTC